MRKIFWPQKSFLYITNDLVHSQIASFVSWCPLVFRSWDWLRILCVVFHNRNNRGFHYTPNEPKIIAPKSQMMIHSHLVMFGGSQCDVACAECVTFHWQIHTRKLVPIVDGRHTKLIRKFVFRVPKSSWKSKCKFPCTSPHMYLRWGRTHTHSHTL